MKFKVGDKVRIRKNLRALSDADFRSAGYVEEMCEYEGEADSITKVVSDGVYRLKRSPWLWTDEMLIPLEAEEAPATDDNPYWARITEIAQSQRRKGLETYGHPLEDFQTPDAKERIRYIEEELIDALMYLEWLQDRK